MSMLRSKVREAEADPLQINEILNNYDSAKDFIDLYLKRNPSKGHPEFLKFYKELDVSSQVILYRETREMIEDDRFEYECVMKYCVEEHSDLFCDIIKNIRNSRMLFQVLGNGFSLSVDSDADSDLFMTKCLVLALSTHTIEQNEVSVLISAIGQHFSDSRRKYYEHGAIVAGVLFKTTDFNIELMEETQKIIEYIPEGSLRSEEKKEFRNPNDVFASYRRVENDLSSLKSLWRPKYLQEGIKVILEEKDIDRIETTFKCFPELVGNATERILRSRGKDAFDALMGYDGCEEYKVEAICELLQKSFNFVINEALDDFFSSKLCLRSKIILLFAFRRIVGKGSYEHAKFLCENIFFMYRRTKSEIPKLLKDSLEGFMSEGLRRVIGLKDEMENIALQDISR